MPPRRAPPKAKPDKPAVAEKKQYCGGLSSNKDGELYWDDERARSSSQFAARYLAFEEKGAKALGGRSPSPKRELLAPKGPQNTTGYIDESTTPSGGPASLLHKVMKSSQPSMSFEDQEKYYSRTYPFNYLELKDLQDTATSVERVYMIQSLTGIEKSKTMESVILACRYLEDTEHQNLKHSIFIDLMAEGAEAVLYASAFEFERLITLELSEKSKSDAIRTISRIPGLKERSTVLCGSFHDYFFCDAQVMYMDCCRIINPRLFGDEGVLVNKIFTLYRTLLPGAFLVLITFMADFDAGRDFQAPWMKLLLKATVGHGTAEESTLRIYGLEFKG